MGRLKDMILPEDLTSDPDPSTLEKTATDLVAAGFSVIPIRSDQSKAPSIPWKTYQNRRATPPELHHWYGGGQLLGIAVVGGKVSGGLEIIDFDEPELFEPWQDLIEEANADLLDNLPIVLTPSGGYHLFYRCREIEGNQKLAQRKGETHPEVMIETRGEGGYVLIPGCPPECHAEGGEYILINGSLNQIPVISKRDRSTLLDSARSFDASINDVLHTKPSAMTWAEILEPYGWRKGTPRPDKVTSWTRPGKNQGGSATSNFGGTDEFHCFSTNGSPFESERFYSKNEAYTLLNPTENTPSKGWPDLEPLPTLLPTAPDLDPDLLPQSLKPWLLDESHRMQAPLSMFVIPALIALSSVVGRSIAIFPKEFDDWQVIPTLWGAVVARSGTMKSPAQQRAMRPLEVLVSEAEKEHKEAMLDALAEDEIFKAKIKSVNDEIKSAVGGGLSCRELKTKLATLIKQRVESMPTKPRYKTSDPTTEKLAEIMAENENGVLLIRDELSGWLRNLEKDNRQGDREFYLESWAGDSSFTVDRIGRGTIEVAALCLSLCGGIQPAKLARYVTESVEEGWGDDGLLQRLQLSVYPEIPGKWELVDQQPDMKAYNQALEVFRRLDGLKKVKPVRLLGGVPGLHFDPDAQEFFNYWLWSLEQRLRSDEITCEAVRSHLSKYRSLMPTLAVLLHLADAPGKSPVTLEAAEKAAALCDYFEAHAKKIYAPAINPGLQAAHFLAGKIKAGKIADGGPVREIYRRQWHGLTTGASVRSGLNVLEEFNWIRCEDVDPATGRPSEIVRLNPALKKS
ncbi:MAG: DUF3987 domain-containing protein [Deltaproteobacteria bacterium]|nr:DUF3987 domain-containing protein [Deltaproteobacteria bacterium]